MKRLLAIWMLCFSLAACTGPERTLLWPLSNPDQALFDITVRLAPGTPLVGLLAALLGQEKFREHTPHDETGQIHIERF